MIYSPFDFSKQRPQWAMFLKRIRQFLDERKYTEVTTPALVTCGAFESTIDTLKVSFSTGSGELHSSPEIEMKSLLAEFPEPIYQICKCFRDDPETHIHAKEFTLLEFYRPQSSSKDIEEETLALFSFLSTKPLVVERHSIYELIFSLTKIDLEKCTELESFIEEVQKKTNIHMSLDDSWADIFFKIMIDIVEPQLPRETLVLLNGYPMVVSPLSKPIQGTSKAERFEVYWKSMELCNGCSELTDEAALRQRYLEESGERIRSNKTAHPEPEKLFSSAKSIAKVSGVAIGLERLFIALNDR